MYINITTKRLVVNLMCINRTGLLVIEFMYVNITTGRLVVNLMCINRTGLLVL